MNKIKVNHQIEIEPIRWRIEKSQRIELPVENPTFYYVISVAKGVHCDMVLLGEKLNATIEIIQEEESNVLLSSFLENSNHKTIVKLKGENATIQYIQSSLNHQDAKSQVTIYHQASRTKSTVFCNGFSINQAKTVFEISGYVEKQSKNCSCMQDSKIIELDDSTSQINPNLYIENYDVEASHSAYVGPFNKQDLFYLKSRGIQEEQAIKLLVKSLLLGKLQIEESKRSKLIEKIESQKLTEN
ncbi:MAG: hypothetical protein HFG40_00475 [Bacilli bacterium]|nr:hypothetical protein [Bacilli bacterium]